MNNQAVKWKIYIVGHKKIHEDLMRGDKRFNNHNYTFLMSADGELETVRI